MSELLGVWPLDILDDHVLPAWPGLLCKHYRRQEEVAVYSVQQSSVKPHNPPLVYTEVHSRQCGRVGTLLHLLSIGCHPTHRPQPQQENPLQFHSCSATLT